MKTPEGYVILSLPSRERGLKCAHGGWRLYGHWSLPSRERGLKSILSVSVGIRMTSLPSRERGLKLPDEQHDIYRDLSLPSRERGLKSRALIRGLETEIVAPFTGAWIEIQRLFEGWKTP